MKALLALLACALLLLGCTSQPPVIGSVPNAPGQNASVQPKGTPHEQLLNSLKSAPAWNVLYSVKQSNEATTILQYVKGANMRTDLLGRKAADAQTHYPDAGIYQLGSSAYFCVNSAPWSCMRMKNNYFTMDNRTPRDLLYNPVNALEAKPARYSVALSGTMQAAGTTASCYALASLTGQGSVRYCVSPQGVPLYMDYAPGAFSTYKTPLELSATVFSATATDGDFELPAQVKAG